MTCTVCGGPIPPDSSSERFCSRKCLLRRALAALDKAAEMNEAMPVDIAGPCQYVFALEEHAVLMRMESELADPLLDAAEAGSRLTKILDARMMESAKNGPVWRYSTALERRGDEAWSLYRSFTRP
jgi:hypothetical protein